MNFHPAFDVLQKHGIRPVTNSPDGTFNTNCRNPKCGKANTNFVCYDDESVGWHCEACGDSRIVPLRRDNLRHGDTNPQTGDNGGGIPFMLTVGQKVELRALGYSDEQIRHLTPQERQDILAQKRKASASAPTDGNGAPRDDDEHEREQREREERERQEREERERQEREREKRERKKRERKPPTIAEAAHAYHVRGWKPVPISRQTKRPIGKEWQKRDYDPAQFKGNAQNVGVQLGKVSGGLTDVDLDCAEAIGFAPAFLPATSAIFGRKSKPASHWLYVTDLCETDVGAVMQFPEYVGGKSDAMIVELRVGGKRDGEYKGATSVFPPSLHASGETVEWTRDGEPANVAGDGLVHVVRKLAVASLLKRHYPGVGSRHEGALVIGGVLVRAGWNADDIGYVVEQVARAVGDDEVADRVETAKGAVVVEANGGDVAGLDRLHSVWGDVVADTLKHWLKLRTATPPDEEERLLAELNRDHCVVKDGGKTWVLCFEEMEHAAGGERYTYRVPVYMSFRAFCDFYLNRHIMAGIEKPKWVDIGSWWLSHLQRRQYHGVIFRPGDRRESIDGKLNLWTGWGVEPKRGDWSLLRKHLREVLAAGDEKIDRYNYNWLAWSVQNPGEQATAALVFIGDPGTGKGTLGNAMCQIFGQHSLHISSAEDLTGKFNDHLRQCCFLFGDECYAPQDRRAEGQIKRVITESTLFIEPKGRGKFRVPNLLHVMLASNHDWVVPACPHERRYMVEKVAETHRQDAKWFDPIYEQMRNGGYEAMLFDLLNHKLGDWHPRRIVHTAALAEQQEESLSPLDAWWLELLQTGVLAGADDLSPDRATSNRYEVEIVERDSGGGGYGGRSYDGGISSGYGSERTRTIWRDGLYDQARRSSPRLKGATDAALGRYLKNKQGCKRAWVHRERGWQFPPLAECRKRWNKRFPDTEWDDTKDWTYPKDDPDVAAKERDDRARSPDDFE